MQGKIINGFILQRQLGMGGMAEVWYAENEIGMKAAVKIMSDELSRNAQMRERFLNEAKVMVKLDHPNIRKVHGYGEVDGRPAIIMEYLDGSDLKARMKSGQRFTDEELVKWWNQLVDALNYTHAQNIVHRDIKPSNIFVDQHGNVKLLDFGIAKVTETTTGTQTGSTLGTRIYMSPEQVKDPKRVGVSSDVYSLAVTFVHLLTGKAPYDNTTSNDYDIQVSIVTKPVDLSDMPANWRDFLEPYLNKEPQSRPDLRYFASIKKWATSKTKPKDEETIVEEAKPKQTRTTGKKPNLTTKKKLSTSQENVIDESTEIIKNRTKKEDVSVVKNRRAAEKPSRTIRYWLLLFLGVSLTIIGVLIVTWHGRELVSIMVVPGFCLSLISIVFLVYNKTR